MAFQFDTSGTVNPTDSTAHVAPVFWDDLSPFAQGYIEELFASEVDNDGDPEVPAGLTFAAIGKGFRHLAPETLARIIADCEAFTSGAAHDHGGDRKAKGAAFWKARNAIPALGNGRFPPLTVQLGDDGKVRFAPEAAQPHTRVE